MEKAIPTAQAVAVHATDAAEAQVQTAVNSLFEQRNREIQQRKDEVEAGLARHRQEYRTLKEQMLALNGEEFVARIEEDEDFRKGNGPGFEGKFLNHKFPAITRMANLRQQIVDEEMEIEQLDRNMAHLAANPAAMMMSPAELYAMIEEQKREIARLRRLVAANVAVQDEPWVFETVLLAHTVPVKHLEWSPDGERLVSASNDGEIFLWGIDGNLESSVKLDSRLDELSRIIWCPDGGRIAIGSWNVSAKGGHSLQFFDGRTGASLGTVQSSRGLLAAYWSDETTFCVVEYNRSTLMPWTQPLGVTFSVVNCAGPCNQQRPVQFQSGTAGDDFSCLVLSPSTALIAIIYRADSGPSALDVSVYDGRTGEKVGAVTVRLEFPKPNPSTIGHRQQQQHVWNQIPAACCFAEWSNDEQFLMLQVKSRAFVVLNLRTCHTHGVTVHGQVPTDCCWHTVKGQDVLLARFGESCWLLDPTNPRRAPTAVDPAVYPHPLSVRDDIWRRVEKSRHASRFNLPCDLRSYDTATVPRKATIDGRFIVVRAQESFLQGKQTFEMKDGL